MTRSGTRGRRAAIALAATLLAATARAGAETGATPRVDVAPRIGAAEAIERSRELDGKIVEFEGEAFGEAMRRGDHSWVNLYDEGTAIGIWIGNAELPPGLSLGSYERTGDRLLVAGVLYRACPEHGGDLDIHAERVSLVRAGARTPHPVDPRRLAAAIILAMLSAALLPLWRARERAASERSRSPGR